jgi:hypothetical protein
MKTANDLTPLWTQNPIRQRLEVVGQLNQTFAGETSLTSLNRAARPIPAVVEAGSDRAGGRNRGFTMSPKASRIK